VKEYCPKTLPLFEEYRKGAFGKRLNVLVKDPVNMHLSEYGVDAKAQRQAYLERRRQIDTAPKAEMGASDF
jgi:hypothetical protein